MGITKIISMNYINFLYSDISQLILHLKTFQVNIDLKYWSIITFNLNIIPLIIFRKTFDHYISKNLWSRTIQTIFWRLLQSRTVYSNPF